MADFIGIGREVDGQIVAAFGFDFHQEKSCLFHVAAQPGGINRDFLRWGFWVPFVQWGYACLTGVVQAGNVNSRGIAARLGFTERLVLADAHPSGALHWFSMYSSECPWLIKNENKNNERWRRQGAGSAESIGADQ